MKRLTLEEFTGRTQAIQRAMRIFGHMTDNDITRAFTAYQLVLAETPRKIMLNTEAHGNRSPTIFDRYERQKCPECGADMMIRRVPPNDEGIKAQFVCSNNACDVVLDSPMTMEEIRQELEQEKQRKEAENAGPQQTE